MKKYKVQWAYLGDISEPTLHTVEAAARGEVVYLLGTWIRRGLESYMESVNSSPLFTRYPELEKGILFMIPEIKRLIGSGMVWEAYDLWEDFYLQFENATGDPLYTKTGTVIVEGSKNTGLKNRIPLLDPSAPRHKMSKGAYITIDSHKNRIDEALEGILEAAANKAFLKGITFTKEQINHAVLSTLKRVMDKYPYSDEESEALLFAELREGILSKLFPRMSGLGLGAFQRRMVQYGDFGGAWHPARHTNEAMAKDDAVQYLKVLLHHLGVHSDSESRVGRNEEYVAEAKELIQHIHWLLDQKLVWTAYLDYKAFEEKWDRNFAPFPLTMAIGSIRVIPTPEPEEYNG